MIIPHPSYLGVYQDEEKMRSLQSDKYLLGWNQTKKETGKMVVHISLSTLGIK